MVNDTDGRQRKFGFCFVDGVPVSPERTQELLERIAFLRTTHYGSFCCVGRMCDLTLIEAGGFYDFTSDLTMKDTAYTSLALPAHTDTTYFSDPAGLQMFHMLSHTDGEGGASLLVDGFKCAQQLRRENPRAFRALASKRIQWHASGNDGIIITPDVAKPVFGLERSDNGQLLQIRWNNDDRAAMPLHLPSSGQGDVKHVDEWYEAAQLWHDIVTSKQNEYWEQLKPGRVVGE